MSQRPALVCWCGSPAHRDEESIHGVHFVICDGCGKETGVCGCKMTNHQPHESFAPVDFGVSP